MSNEFDQGSGSDVSSSDGDWMSADEAALYLRILRRDGSPCVERVRNLVSAKRIPFYKPFGRLLFKRSELKDLVESSKQRGLRWR